MNTKAVLISIKPKWCKLIMDGQKTVEIRKSRPKIDTPFKCYIYCTQSCGRNTLNIPIRRERLLKSDRCLNCPIGNGKVIGEFVCDNIIRDWTGGHNTALYRDAACLSVGEAAAYCTQFPMYGWHISDLKIYDIPKELSEFLKYNLLEKGCWYAEMGVGKRDCKECRHCVLTKPPQSWQYVKELREVQT